MLRSRCWRALTVALVVWAGALGTSRAAMAQELGVEPTANFDATLAKSRTAVMQALRDGAMPAGLDQAQFIKYFQDHVLAQLLVPANQAAWPSLRADRSNSKGLRVYFVSSKPSPMRKLVNDICLEWAKKVAGRNTFPMAARYNAMLLVADLNQQEADPIAKTPAIPYPPALDFMLRVVTAPQQVPDALRVAALIGIERHTELHAGAPVTGDNLTGVTTAMLNLVKQSQVPQGRSVAGHDWMRRRAAAALGGLASIGNNGDIAKALAVVVTEKNASLMLRCTAAQALGELKYPGSAGLDYGKMIKDLGQLTGEVCEQEFKDAQDNDRKPSKRALKTKLLAINVGLKGPDDKSGLLAAAKDPPHQAVAKAVGDKFAQVWLPFENAAINDDGIKTELEPKLAELKKMLGPAAAAQPPVASAAAAAAAPAPAATGPVAATPAASTGGATANR